MKFLSWLLGALVWSKVIYYGPYVEDLLNTTGETTLKVDMADILSG